MVGIHWFPSLIAWDSTSSCFFSQENLEPDNIKDQLRIGAASAATEDHLGLKKRQQQLGLSVGAPPSSAGGGGGGGGGSGGGGVAGHGHALSVGSPNREPKDPTAEAKSAANIMCDNNKSENNRGANNLIKDELKLGAPPDDKPAKVCSISSATYSNNLSSFVMGF